MLSIKNKSSPIINQVKFSKTKNEQGKPLHESLS